MLTVCDLHMHFGGIQAVDGVSLTIESGTITGLIGPNGAGKTTLFNVIAGLYKPTSGRVLLDGEDITGLPPHALFHKGMLRTFQLAHEEATICKRADEVIEFLQIEAVANEQAGNLSGGQKKLLELGRTMMVDAKIVFLDEVGAGVNRTLLNVIGDAVLRLNRERGYTFCMIEHDMEFISRLCDPVIVMAEGQVLACGSADAVKNNDTVIEAYLGTGLKNLDEVTS